MELRHKISIPQPRGPTFKMTSRSYRLTNFEKNRKVSRTHNKLEAPTKETEKREKIRLHKIRLDVSHNHPFSPWQLLRSQYDTDFSETNTYIW